MKTVILLLPLLGSVLGQFLKLELIRHQGCSWKKSASWNRKLEFQGGSNKAGAQLSRVEGHAGCYSMQGRVTVHEDVTDEILIFLSVSTTGDTSRPPDVCRDADQETGCGGIGSCLYCRPCESLGGLSKVLGAQLIVNGKVAGCEPLKKGVYDEVELRFCLPNVQSLLEWQGISEKAIDNILAASSVDGNGIPKLSLFVTVYVFDKDVRSLLVSQRKLEDRIRKFFRENLAELKREMGRQPGVELGFHQWMDHHASTFSEKFALGDIIAPPMEGLTTPFTSFEEPVNRPAEFSLRDKATPVKNQGSCGSCWAFATVASIETLNVIAGNPLVGLSEQEMIECDTRNQGCKGGVRTYAMSFVMQNGLVPESTYPYTAKEGEQCHIGNAVS
ncbi:hypothetical protein PMAYCL1PPCAC_04379, partial [Pristionchus mayeri]